MAVATSPIRIGGRVVRLGSVVSLRVRRRGVVVSAVLLVLLAALFVCYVYVERLLPSNY